LPKYSEVNWEQAGCTDVYPDLFYQVEEERSTQAYDFINSLRSICTACPIWKECLSYAIENEQYGMWGGMTSQERASISDPLKYPNQRTRALHSLKQHGITLEQIKECL
jgi:WhiB family redox-sensing transcriptional regulator